MAVFESTGYASLILGPHAFDEIFADSLIEVRTGVQPANADAPPTGSLLGYISTDTDPWTSSTAPDGSLQFDRVGRYAVKKASQNWVLYGVASGTPGWFRLRRPLDSGLASIDAPRIDGAIGPLGTTEDAQLYLPGPAMTITASSATEILQWFFAKPPL